MPETLNYPNLADSTQHRLTSSVFCAKSLLKILLGFCLILFCLSAEAQNTKGDQAAPPASSQPKLKKGKPLKKKKPSGARIGSAGQRNRNVFSQRGPFVNNPSKGPKKEKASPIRLPGSRISQGPSGQDKAWSGGNIGRRKIRSASSANRARNVFPQSGPFVNNPSPRPKSERPSTVRLPSAVRSQRQSSRTGRNRNVYSQRGPFVNNPSSRPKKESASNVRFPSAISSNRGPTRPRNTFSQSGPFVNNPSRKPKPPGASHNQPLHKARRLSMSQAAAQARSMGIRGAGFKTITSQFITKGKKDVYWGKFRKGEKAITTDIAGRKLRTRNYHSPKPGLVGRDTLPFFRRSPKTVARGPSGGGGFKSATRTGAAWKGDISGHKLRRITPRGPAGVGIPWGKGSDSATKTGRASLNPLPRKGRSPSSFAAARYKGRTKGIIGGSGFGAQGLGFAGRRKSRQPLKGGGSVSGKSWNNKNNPVAVKLGGAGTLKASQYKGRTKGFISGKGYDAQGTGFSGSGKTRGPLKGGGSVSGKHWSNGNSPIPVRQGGVGSYAAGTFQGRTKGQRPLKGGGSVSGKHWSNNNSPIAVKQGGVGSYAAGTFQGRTKGQRPLKGGGSVSGKHWNNNNNPIAVRQGGVGSYMAGTFQGRTKGQRPLKGGGSVSGKHWSNHDNPIAVKQGGVGSYMAGTFQGRTKGQRPLKGGGSVSGKHWSNHDKPTSVNTSGAGQIQASQFKGRTKGIVGGQGFDAQGVNFPGYAKTKRPAKGGGSISGKHWSNNDKPVSVNTSGAGQIQASQFRGRTRYRKPAETAGKPATFQGKIPGAAAGPSLTEIGFDYEGDYKRKKHRINNRQTTFFAKLLNIDKSDALKVTHSKRDESMVNYRPNSKRYIFSRYVQNPKAHDESLKKDRLPNGLIINLPIANQMRRSVNAGHYSHSVKRDFAYKRNPNSARGALKLREPGKAYARMGDFQTNLKMRKPYHGELHPDSKFAHGFRDNVKDERTLFMNIKLTWAKLFKKSDTQPRGLKQKVTKPRYNPNEKGLWYD